jgi:catechol 2,3-dioxygenase-like lactoylglutathione lyase family enzyme
MITSVTHASIWVKDQDDALKFYRDTLGFKVTADNPDSMPGYRWLTVAPARQDNFEIVLNLATTPEQLAGVGRQGIFILTSNDINADYTAFKAKGVKFQSEINVNPWGSDFVFEDLYGNDFDLVQRPAEWTG